MKLPKINLSLNTTLDKEFFITDTDDIGFANSQVKQIDKRLKTKQVQKLKPWERFLNTNIYSSLNKTNRELIKDKKRKIKNNSLSFNWNNQNYFNNTELDNILRCEEIKKQVKIKYDIKYKFKEPNTSISNFVSTRNETFLTNKMINILKQGKNDILNKQENREKSLKYENKSLDKDIDKFNEFTMKLKKKTQENEILLNKVIADNKNLVDLYKKQLQEYNSTVYDVYKNLKLISDYKHYASFIHKILGGDSEILHCDLIEELSFNEFKNGDIFAITKKILKKTKNIINSKSINVINEYMNLNDEITINSFDNSFKSMEQKIIKKFVEKEGILTEIEEIIRKGKNEENEKRRKYDELYRDYKNQMKELDERKDEINKIHLTPDEISKTEFDYELLKDIYSLLFGNFRKTSESKELKAENAYDMYKEVVSPIVKEIYNKEEKVNNLIKLMEEYEKDNKVIFNKVLIRRKLENRAWKIFQEKELIKIKENLRRKKYNNKMKKVIFKGRYKYNSPITPETTKFNLNRVIKTEMNISDFNMLNYN